MRDDLGEPVELTTVPARVVSLVPSLTESVARTGPGILVGATDWCTEPAGLAVPRVGGSKYPRVEDVLACTPDLVLANAEENRPEDVAALRAAKVPVWVTYPRTVDGALRSLGRMFEVLRLDRPGWLTEAARVWAEPYRGTPRQAVVAVWRRPWVWLGQDTFASDVLRHLGVVNVLAIRSVTRAGSRPTCWPAIPNWWCCPTSRTGSAPRTGRRCSRRYPPRCAQAGI